MKAVTIALMIASALSQAARAEDAVPSTLLIGYENEGKVDASPQACLAHVKEMTEWDKAATERGAKEVCAARKHHVDAYADLQRTYKVFVDGFLPRSPDQPPGGYRRPQDHDQSLHGPQIRHHDRRPQHLHRHHRERDRCRLYEIGG